jgi:CBS-domain-containing membrane protein
MLRWQVNALPVIDHGRLVGIVTTADCLRALVAQLHEQARHQQATGVMDDDPDWYKLTPMPTGDDRPGRRTRPVPAAVKTVQQSPATAVVAASSADALTSVSLVKEPTGIAG